MGEKQTRLTHVMLPDLCAHKYTRDQLWIHSESNLFSCNVERFCPHKPKVFDCMSLFAQIDQLINSN